MFSTRTFLSAFLMLALMMASANGFTTSNNIASARIALTRVFTPAPVNVFGKKKSQDDDLSSIESRDMTREEMMELNAKNEDIMNMELQAMTGFSLILSLPILYLCWVAFFSD
jgi:selenocysteine-specific elongation factor